jgi:hypothetical protein
MKMIIRKRPVKPKRKTFTLSLDAEDYTLSQIKFNIEYTLAEAGYSEEEIEENVGYDTIKMEMYGYEYERTVAAVINLPESNAEFQRRENTYRRQLKEYNEWKKDNKEEIEAELKRREDKKNKELQRQIEKEEARLAKLKSKLKV